MSNYMLYGIKMIENDATLKGFAICIMKNSWPAEVINFWQY